jgi:zinc transporter 2
MSFGYYRSEVLGALFSILIIWILTGVLVYMAVIRLVTQDFEIDSIAMVTTASCGVFFNIVMYFVLHTNRCFNGVELSHHGHSHSGNNHGHSHGLSDNHGHSHSNNRNIDHCIQNNSEVHGNNMLTKENSITMTHLSGNLNLAANTDINSGESAIAHGQVVLKVEDCHEEPVVVTPINDASNINLRAAAIHVIGDFIQSVGVLVAALIIYFEVNF